MFGVNIQPLTGRSRAVSRHFDRSNKSLLGGVAGCLFHLFADVFHIGRNGMAEIAVLAGALV
ncbi:MAG: hypothetical protein IPM07_24855 [Anaerolineales bacterium]|nr:hypothetical protein [Anaerolineales bacterium]